MRSPLTDQLKDSTLILKHKKTGDLIGTGFFITDSLFLTANHNLPDPIYHLEIEYPRHGEILAPWKVIKRSERLDYAIININEPYDLTPCLLGSKYQTGDQLYLFGYTLENPFGDSATIRLEGKSSNRQGYYSIKTKEGEISQGMSGSPVLNLHSGKVVGMMLETRNLNRPSGGYFVPMEEVLADALNFDDKIKRKPIFLQNRKWHINNVQWFASIETNEVGLGLLDETWNDGHFNIFPRHELHIDDVFIEPRANLIRYQNDEFKDFPLDNLVLAESLRIIESQSILFITGAYGAGKSLLSRLLQLRLLEQGFDTVFVGANKLLRERNGHGSIYRLIHDKAKVSEKLHVFIDAFDELNSLFNHDMNRETELLKELIDSCKKADAVLVINYRTLEPDEEYVQYFSPILCILEYYNQSIIDFIRINYFNSSKVREWVDNHADLMQSKYERRLIVDNIHNVNKNFIVACQNPLLLYIIARDFYNASMEFQNIKNIYDLYSRFVDDTIQGKFAEETTVGNPVIQQLGKEGYKKMLQEIAFEISKKSKHFTIIESSNPDDLILDRNEKIYSISDKDTEACVARIASLQLPGVQLNMKALDLKLLNCYFFSQYQKTWRFKDNNILFFFLAEKIYGYIGKTIELYQNDTDLNPIFEALKGCAEVALHPITIELLLNKLSEIPSDSRQVFVHILRCLINKELTLSVSANTHDFKIDYQKINLDIFLCILFVQLNREGYHGISFFFKRFTWYLSIAKRINPNMVFLAKRFYKSAQISEAEFRRVNLKGYNFDETILKEVKFIQSKIYGVRKNNSQLYDVKYLLCEMHDVELDNWSGYIEFENCLVKTLVIKNPMEKPHISFDKCSLIDLQITCDKKRSFSISLKNCYIQKIIVNNCELRDLTLTQNVIQHIQLSRSIAYCYKEKNIEIGNGIKCAHGSELRIIMEND